MRPLHSWGQLVSLACLYFFVAACVHALAVWSVCHVQREGVREWVLMWPVVWGAWIAVVWLPLLALLTSEHSRWVTLVLPITAVFVVCFVSAQRQTTYEEDASWGEDRHAAGLLAQPEEQRIWRMLLPSFLTVMVAEAGVACYVGGHAWRAGALFAAASAYAVKRLLDRMAVDEPAVSDRSLRCASAGNSVAVWMLTVVALLPFLAGMTVAMRGVLGMPGVRAASHMPNMARGSGAGYTGIILTLPRKPHEIVTPALLSHETGFARSRVIPFDGRYWYFQAPDQRPGVHARVVQGTPLKSRIRSTNDLPLAMEAHQPLGQEMAMDCCRTMQLNLVNADAVPGSISIEVLLRDTQGRRAASVVLGDKVLPSSVVSPMPLHRAPVHETLTFRLPRAAKSRMFDEITVRVKPDVNRSLAAPQVSIESFAFQP
jgi:hypothetical protein